MKKGNLSTRKTPFLLCLMVVFIYASHSVIAQQFVINQKDVTRPEVARQSIPAFISSFTATKWNGYNELSWATTYQQQTRRFIVEYSVDGINYQAAAEALADRNLYTVKHQILDNRPLLYRVRTEQVNGRSFYSPAILLQGESALPVKIYPTIVSGSSLTVDTSLPVEKIIVTDEKGVQVLSKEFGVINEKFNVQLPSLNRGIYLMSFIGRDGWRTTEKFIIP